MSIPKNKKCNAVPRNNEIRFEIINRCQYNCKICKKNESTRRLLSMNFAYFKYLLDKILAERNYYKNISFAGIGEPMLNGSIYEMIKYSKEKGLRPLLVTNGEYLTPNVFEDLKKAGLYSVRISFHGATPEGYSKMHGVVKENFHKILKQIHEISKIRKPVKLLLTCVMVNKINKAPIQTWTKLFKGKVDLMEMWYAHNWCDGFKYRKEQKNKMKTCGRIENGPLQIQVDGTVNACCFDWNGKLEFGDLQRNTVKEIFHSAEFKKIAKCHKTGNFKKSGLICEHCDQRNEKKDDVLIYSSKFKVEDRVKRTSTTYEKVMQ